MLALAFEIQSVRGINFIPSTHFEKVLIFEEDFENGIAEWWNEIHGTPTLSTDIVHSGSYSYVTDEDWDSLAHLWFDTSIIGELEVWFYDSMSDVKVTSSVSTTWAPHYVFAAQIWYGGNYEHYYAYRLGFQLPPSLSSYPRSVGWHRVNIIHEPERAYILLDGDLLVEVDHQVSFRGFSIGDNWIYNTISFTYYDDIKVWRYVPVVEATIDINPDTFYLKSQAKWITAYIQLPVGYNSEDIDATTILLNNTIQPVLDPKYGFVTNSSEYLIDHNEDGILERMVKFDRTEVMALLNIGEATLTITGKVNGIPFEGSDTIRVISK